MADNRFSSLSVDAEDTSTGNLSRKLDKMKRMQERNPTTERAIKIEELDKIVNPPPKSIPVKTSKNKKNYKKEKEADKQRLYNERKVEKEKKRIKKEEEERKKEREYEEFKREMKDKEDERKRRKLMSDSYAIEQIDKFKDKKLQCEYVDLKMRGVKYDILMVLDWLGYPNEVIRIIMSQVKKSMLDIPIKLFIQPDIYDYIRRKYKNNKTERTLKLKYHPDKTNGKTNQLYIFLQNVMNSKIEL